MVVGVFFDLPVGRERDRLSGDLAMASPQICLRDEIVAQAEGGARLRDKALAQPVCGQGAATACAGERRRGGRCRHNGDDGG